MPDILVGVGVLVLVLVLVWALVAVFGSASLACLALRLPAVLAYAGVS